MSHHRFDILVTALEGMIKKDCMAAASLEETLDRARCELCRSHRAVPQLSPLPECKHFTRTRNVHHFVAVGEILPGHGFKHIRGSQPRASAQKDPG